MQDTKNSEPVGTNFEGRKAAVCNINIRLQTLLRKTVCCGPIAIALAGESQTKVARISFWVVHIATD